MTIPAPSEFQPPRDLAGRPKVYAYERSLGFSSEEACRRAGGKVEKGHAAKWEQNSRVQAWIAYFRALGFSPEALAAAETLEPGGGFDLARLVNAALRPVQPPVSAAEHRTSATWESLRRPIFYGSWTFWSTARFLPNSFGGDV